MKIKKQNDYNRHILFQWADLTAVKATPEISVQAIKILTPEIWTELQIKSQHNQNPALKKYLSGGKQKV